MQWKNHAFSKNRLIRKTQQGKTLWLAGSQLTQHGSYTHTHTHTHTHAYICLYAYIHTCVCVYTYIDTSAVYLEKVLNLQRSYKNSKKENLFQSGSPNANHSTVIKSRELTNYRLYLNFTSFFTNVQTVSRIAFFGVVSNQGYCDF